MKVIVIILILILYCKNVSAQIQGDIVDQSGIGVANANVTATDSLNNLTDTVMSDSRGFYSFNKLKPGKYNIQFKAVGFKVTILRNILVNKNETGSAIVDFYNGQRLDITLSPAKLH